MLAANCRLNSLVPPETLVRVPIDSRLIETAFPPSSNQWKTRVISSDPSAPVALIRAVWPTMTQQRSGVIVNISSQASRDPFPGLGAYGAAKAGLNLLGLALAREGHPLGIRVHTIAPSATETGMFRQIMTPQQVPTDQVLDPSDVASTIAACVIGDLRYTSGEVIWLHKTV